MTTAAQASFVLDSSVPPNHRFWVSLAVSALMHAIALAIFAAMLLPFPAPVWVRMGQPAVVQVVLSAPEPAPVASPAVTRAEVAAPAVEPVLTPLPEPKAHVPAQHPAPSVSLAEQRPAAANPTGSDMPIAPTPDAVPDDAPTPPGDTAVSFPAAAEPLLGRTQALRLTQRFPQKIDKPPRLKAALVVPYPVRAARSWREARIAALLIVDSAGRVLETTITPEDPLFAPTVRDVLETAAFLPAEAEGGPVTYWIIVEFLFTMRQLPQSGSAIKR